MNAVTYQRAADADAALAARADFRGAGATYLAGGTTLYDLMKMHVLQPSKLVDVSRLPLTKVEATAEGVRIGALAKNTDVASDPTVQKKFPVLSQAILAGATPQIRNMATVGGNLLQRTRCPYYREPHSGPCNKRQPGSGCAAHEGIHRTNAVLGVSDKCFATSPSDMNVALAALEAVVVVRGGGGERRVPFADFYVTYGDDPVKETVLQPGELITAVEIKATPWAARSLYLKVRDRTSYAFALASAAVAVETDGGTIKAARVGLGGVATKPWRSTEAEAALVGKPATAETFAAAAAAALAGAKPHPQNAFKVPLAQRVLARALEMVTADAPDGGNGPERKERPS